MAHDAYHTRLFGAHSKKSKGIGWVFFYGRSAYQSCKRRVVCLHAEMGLNKVLLFYVILPPKEKLDFLKSCHVTCKVVWNLSLFEFNSDPS